MKAALFGLVLFGLGFLASNLAWVVDAYRVDTETEAVRLSGVDLDLAMTSLGHSPYVLPVAPDTRGDGLAPVVAPVPTETGPPALLSAGQARLEGTVRGPDGPVAGAVVRIERHTERGMVGIDVTTDVDGDWVLSSVPGGRYRVRSWVPGLLTMDGSDVRYVGDGQVAPFRFDLFGIDPTPSIQFVHAGPLYEDLASSVALVVGWRSVDADGVIATNPVAGAAVTVESTPEVTIVGSPVLFTNGDGVAWVELRCVPGGGSGGSLAARSGQVAAVFALPGCRPVPPPEPVAEPVVEEVEVDG